MRWQLFDWPPVASHVLCFFVGCGIAGISLPAAPSEVRVMADHLLFAPPRGLLGPDDDRVRSAKVLEVVEVVDGWSGLCRLIEGEVHRVDLSSQTVLSAKASVMFELLATLNRGKSRVRLMPKDLTRQLPLCLNLGVVTYE